MATVSMERTFDADAASVRAAMDDVEQFMAGAGFDDVRLDGDRLVIDNTVGLFDIELVLEVVDAESAALAYEQREGVFEWMRTEYHLEEIDGQTTVTATTEFESTELAVVGNVLDETVVRRQRGKELTAQFDWLAERVE
jgi:hypothetical protein